MLGTSTNGLGASGVGLGYQGVSGNSVAIEFDTYDNTNPLVGYDDGSSSNHVAIDKNGSTAITATANVYGKATCDFSTANPNTAAGCMSNGDLWTVNINYDGAKLTVTLTDPGQGSSFTAINGYAINLASLLGQNTAYVGFTGGTGNGYENQDIVTWTFANTAQGASCSYSLATSSAPVRRGRRERQLHRDDGNGLYVVIADCGRELDHAAGLRHHGELLGAGQHQHQFAHRPHHRKRADLYRDPGRGAGVQLHAFVELGIPSGRAAGSGNSFSVTAATGCTWTATQRRAQLAHARPSPARHGELHGDGQHQHEFAHRPHHRGRQDLYRDPGRRRYGQRTQHQPGRRSKPG